MIKAAVLGATGYTGIELMRLLSGHPGVELSLAGSESYGGKKVSEIHPQFSGRVDLTLEKVSAEEVPRSIDVVFCALPHGKSAEAGAILLKNGFRGIDLSADYRLKQPRLYNDWYDLDHPCPELLGKAVYGLPELNSRAIMGAELIANPGCYPTGIILGLAPLLKHQMIDLKGIIIDAKSGVSGAGRAPRQPFHFPECTENFKAYRVATHQHTPEIEQELGSIAGESLQVTFTPHLVPMVRGILCTMYLKPAGTESEDELYGLYSEFYENSPFVRVLEPPAQPETRFVRGSNYCDLALKTDPRTGCLIVVSAIDNLVKGASGQAVQNMNIMFGYPEDTGLGQVAI